MSIGLARGENLYQIKRGKNGISRELARLIAQRYAHISQGWLMTGEGDMFAEKPLAVQAAVPFYDADVEKYVVAPTRFKSPGTVVVPGAGDVEFGAVYAGKAMGDAIPQGSVVMLRQVAVDRLVPGGDYVVVGDGVALLRRVRREPAADTVRLVPLDTDNFDEVEIAMGDIKKLYAVRAVVINKN